MYRDSRSGRRRTEYSRARNVKRIDTVWQDIAFATRLLRKSPIFTCVVVLTFALGIGVNTAVFSVVNAILFRPLPVRDGDRLTVVASQDTASRTLGPVSFADLEDFRAARAGVFEDIAGYSVGFLGLAAEGGRPDRVLVTWVTGNYFPLLDLAPALGRLIRAEEGGRGPADAVVVLAYSTWQRRFSGDPTVVGRSVRVNGRSCTIVGVAPPGFRGTFAFSESELYLPLNWAGADDFDNRRSRRLHAVARLRPDVTIERAQATMNVVAERLSRAYPDSNKNVVARVMPERFARPEEDQFRTNALGAALILTLAGLVMVVAMVNVANLLLARASSRHSELAIRATLGAGRGRLVRQLVTETLMLAAIGGGAGVLIGAGAARLLARLRLPGDLPVRFDFQLDGRVLMYASVLALVAGLVVGLLPAIRVSGADLDRALRQSRHSSPGGHRRRLGSFLVAAQIACCFVLLAAAGLFVRSLREAERADLGFQPVNVLNVHMDVGQLGYSEAQGRAFFERVEHEVRAIPGVGHLSFAFTIPMGYIRLSAAIEPEGGPVVTGEPVSAGKNIVSSEYFEMMGIPVIRGRSLGEVDDERARRVAIVNERLAQMLWPGHDPIGRRFRADGPTGAWLEVVGVTRTGKNRFLFEDPQPFFYVPIAQEYTGLRVLQVRSGVPAAALAPAIENVIRAIEPDLPLYDVQSMRQALGSGPGLFPVRVGAAAAATLGLLAFTLAIIGLYGVVSDVARQRTHEIGIRVAIGATQKEIVRLVVQNGLSLVVFGLSAGLLVVLAGSRLLEHALFRVSPHDPLVLVGIPLVLGCVALLACTIPAWRAARVDPMIALRSE